MNTSSDRSSYDSQTYDRGSSSSTWSNQATAFDGANDLEAGRAYHGVSTPASPPQLPPPTQRPPVFFDGVNERADRKSEMSLNGDISACPTTQLRNSIHAIFEPETPRSSCDTAVSKRAVHSKSPRENDVLSSKSGNSLHIKAAPLNPFDSDASSISESDSDDEGNARAMSSLEAAGAPSLAAKPASRIAYRRSLGDMRPSIESVLSTIPEYAATSPRRKVSTVSPARTSWHGSLPLRGPRPLRVSIVKSRLERLRIVCEEHAAREGYLLNGTETNTEAG